jgi:hypothetical protein
MSWEASQKDGKYRIWSTISDAWLTDWIDRNEAIKLYYDCTLLGFKKKIIEQYYKFPHFWVSHDSNNCNIIYDEEGHRRFVEWMQLLNSKKDPDEYYKLIDEIYEKIMKTLNAEVEQ